MMVSQGREPIFGVVEQRIPVVHRPPLSGQLRCVRENAPRQTVKISIVRCDQRIERFCIADMIDRARRGRAQQQNRRTEPGSPQMWIARPYAPRTDSCIASDKVGCANTVSISSASVVSSWRAMT